MHGSVKVFSQAGGGGGGGGGGGVGCKLLGRLLPSAVDAQKLSRQDLSL